MVNDERFLVSGWDDDLNDIDPTRQPQENIEKEIFDVAENGSLERMIELIDMKPELVDLCDKDKYTPLHRACYSNQVEAVKILLQRNAKIDAVTEMGWQPLHSCCQWNHKECAQVLIEHGADVNAISSGGQTPLHIAASHGANYDIVQLLLSHPFIQPDIKNSCNETAEDIAKRSSKYYNIFDVVKPVLNTANLELL